MKIIILVRILWTSGAQKIAIKEAQAISALGHDVQLVFLRATESGKNLLSELDKIKYKIFTNSTYKPKFIYSAITGIFAPDRKGEGTVDYDLLKEFAASIKPDECDYIVCHDVWAGVAGLQLKKKYGIPYSVYVHERIGKKYGIPVIGYLAQRIERNVLINANKVLGVTNTVSVSVKEKFNVECIPDLPGMDLQKFYSFDEKKNMLLSSATWDQDRDPVDYLNIIDFLPDFELFIVGRWRNSVQRDNFKRLIVERRLSERVHFIDSIDETEMSDLYAKAKFLLRFGKNEAGVGTSTIESISHLTPVIVSSLGISDLIVNYGGGFVLDDKTPEKAAKIIKENNKKENYDTLQAHLQRITSLYTWEQHSNLLINYSDEEHKQSFISPLANLNE